MPDQESAVLDDTDDDLVRSVANTPSSVKELRRLALEQLGPNYCSAGNQRSKTAKQLSMKYKPCRRGSKRRVELRAGVFLTSASKSD